MMANRFEHRSGSGNELACDNRKCVTVLTVVQSPQRPPPPEKTRPSSMSRATEWYVLGFVSGGRIVKVCEAGSHSSGVRTALVSVNGTGYG